MLNILCRYTFNIALIAQSLIFLSDKAFANEINIDKNLADQTTSQEQKTTKKVKAFTAKYSLLRKSDPVGTAVRHLEYLDNGQANFSYHTNIEWLIFSDERKESSLVSVDGNKIVPIQYSYKREGTGRDKHYKWQYNAKKHTAYNVKKQKTIEADFSLNLQDPLSYHLQHRINMINNPTQKHFVYPVIKTSGTIKNYVYEYDGEEELMLPYGIVKTIRLKREVIEKKRITYAWFAPELNYLLVKLYQSKKGVEQFEAQLTSLETE
ncbi:MAG: DUF3108 domain-containing protein [Alteromonadaceae bacterium]|nr:DUF3108 domain-containing protein [Alteromonadaceae bacterium]